MTRKERAIAKNRKWLAQTGGVMKDGQSSCTPRQAQAIVKVADRRHKINLHGVEAILTKQEAHDLLQSYFDGGPRGHKVGIMRDLKERLAAHEREAALNAEREAITGRNENVIRKIDDDFSQKHQAFNYLIENLFDDDPEEWTYDPIAEQWRTDHALFTHLPEAA